MNRVLILVEGQTEETFVRELLNPHLLEKGVWLQAVILKTKRVKKGGAFRGGVTSYPKTRSEILRLLGDTGASMVTTMLDLYGLPDDFPGFASRPAGPPEAKVEHLEHAFGLDINHRCFRSYLSLHEFEALLFTEPNAIAAKVLPCSEQVRESLVQTRSQVSTPEHIDDGGETAPSKRIQRVLPHYEKVGHGPRIAQAIGLQAIRAACPHFDSWLKELEVLGV